MAPIFEKAARDTTGVKFYKVDVDEHQDIARKYNVHAMPTFLAFKGNEQIGKVMGARGQIFQVCSLVDPTFVDPPNADVMQDWVLKIQTGQSTSE
jgi:thioredoxin-like negative regulator of GroEL